MHEAKGIVIIGGGVAGVDIASHLGRQSLRDGRFDVTLVDREAAHVWKPMLHTIAAGTSDAGTQQTAYAAQAKRCGFRYQPGAAIGIDRARREITVGSLCVDGEEVVPQRILKYDALVLAVGSRANDFGTAGVADQCRTIDSRAEAIAFNDRLRIRLLQSAVSGEPLTIGIVGGGATGVELAAELIQAGEIADQLGATGTSTRVRVTLIESGDRLLAPFPERISLQVRRKLVQLGVDVRTSARVAGAEEHGFRLENGELVPAALRVWAAGVQAPDLLATLEGLDRSKTGRLVVDATLRCPRDPHIFAVGDCSSLTPKGEDRPLPTTAQAAHQQAGYLCRHFGDILDGRSVSDFRYRDFGSLVSLGGYDAYGSLGRFGFFRGGFIRGRVAQVGHAMLYRSHQARLHGFWRGGLLWLADTMAARVKPAARLA